MTVEACPECDSTDIYRRMPSVQDRDHDHAWVCMSCGERFDDPEVRERGAQGGIRSDCLAYQLDQMDPDEVGP